MLKSILASCLFLALSCVSLASSAQTIAQWAGALTTDFTFTVANEPLGVTYQHVLKRAKAIGTDLDGGGGYGYESYHLEFTTSAPDLITRERLNGHTYIFTFYDEEDNLLLRRGMSLRTIDPSNSIVGKTYFYSLNLINLPITLLDKTKRIDITVR